jgi:type IV secretory pathway TraG/TraD family ATPase VirD4
MLNDYGTQGHTAALLLLDEFANLGHINNFASIATTLRKRQCSINIILQELAQLATVYGQHEAKAIYSGGMGNKLFLSGLDLETCTYLEKVLGHNTEYDTPFGGSNEKARTIAKPLMTADEIRMLSEKEGLLISGRERPIKIKLPPYFKDARLNTLSQKKPIEITLDYSGEKVDYLQF